MSLWLPWRLVLVLVLAAIPLVLPNAGFGAVAASAGLGTASVLNQQGLTSAIRLYTANYSSNDVSVINPSASPPAGGWSTVPVGSSPIAIALAPNGRRVYTANFNAGTVSIINTATNAVDFTVPVGSVPHGVAVTPDSGRVYVSNSDPDDPYGGRVAVIDANSNPPAVMQQVPVGWTPQGVAVSADGSRVYVANTESDTVSIIETGTNTVTDHVSMAGCLYGTPLEVAVYGQLVFVSLWGNGSSNQVAIIDASMSPPQVNGCVDMHDQSGNTYRGPRGLAINTRSNGQNVLYASMVYNADRTAADKLLAFNISCFLVCWPPDSNTPIAVGSSPYGMATSPDQTRLYVANSGCPGGGFNGCANSVSVIDTGNNYPQTALSTNPGRSPWDVAAGNALIDVTKPVTTASPSPPAPNMSGYYTTDVTVTLSATDDGGSGVKEIVYSLSGAQTGGATVAGNSAQVRIAAEGTTTLTYFARDNVVRPAPNQEDAKTLTVKITRDTTRPTFSSFKINGGAVNTTALDVRLTNISASDNSSPAFMSFSNTNSNPNDNTGWSSWEPFATTRPTPWSLAWPASDVPDGRRTVYARVMDIAGNVSTTCNGSTTTCPATITLDRTVQPNYGLVINEVSPGVGATYTRDAKVRLSIGALPGTGQMQISDNGQVLNTTTPQVDSTGKVTNTGWIPYESHYDWYLPPCPGNTSCSETVYVWFKLWDGTLSSQFSDQIIFDTVPPNVTVSVVNRTSPSTVSLTINAVDPGIVGQTASGMRSIQVSAAETFPAGSTTTFTCAATGCTQDVTNFAVSSGVVFVRASDAVANNTDVKVALASVGVSAMSYPAASQVSGSWSIPCSLAHPAPWAGLYRASDTSDASPIDTKPVSTTTVCSGTTSTTVADSGQVPFSAPTTTGDYNLRLFSDKLTNGGIRMAISPTFAVTGGTTACIPRPNVRVSVGPASNGRLPVTITAGSGVLTQVSIGSDPTRVPNPNALIQLDSQTMETSGLNAQPGTTTFGFSLRPANSSQAVTLPLQIVDGCGTVWSTLVGGGPSVFAGGARDPVEVPVTRLAEPPAVVPMATPAPTPTPAPR